MGKFIDLTGQKFNRLTVVSRAESNGKKVLWNCKCDCGSEAIVISGHLKNGNTKSCGCLNIDKIKERLTTHGMKWSPEYKSWEAMMQRCNNEKRKDSKDYLGRGISVCDEWRSFEKFYADMGHRPEGTSLDRIDNDGNYEPGNCRWATSIEQGRNQRTNRMLSFNGKVMCLSEWASELGMSVGTLHSRLNKYKWTIEKSLTTPHRPTNNKG